MNATIGSPHRHGGQSDPAIPQPSPSSVLEWAAGRRVSLSTLGRAHLRPGTCSFGFWRRFTRRRRSSWRKRNGYPGLPIDEKWLSWRQSALFWSTKAKRYGRFHPRRQYSRQLPRWPTAAWVRSSSFRRDIGWNHLGTGLRSQGNPSGKVFAAHHGAGDHDALTNHGDTGVHGRGMYEES